MNAAPSRELLGALLDVRMERVVHHSDPRMPDRAHELREVGRAVREVHLEPVEVFERNRDVSFVRIRADFPQIGRGARLLLARRPGAGEDGERSRERAADQRRAERFVLGSGLVIDGGLNAGKA
jgi:hypothetical protein